MPMYSTPSRGSSTSGAATVGQSELERGERDSSGLRAPASLVLAVLSSSLHRGSVIGRDKEEMEVEEEEEEMEF